MITKYYVDDLGNYLGGFQGAPPPKDAIEVPFAPDHAKDEWDGTGYIKYQQVRQETLSDLKAVLISKGILTMDDFKK